MADLAAEVLTPTDPWKELARAGLLDVSPPDGLGVLEVAVLLTEIGRRAPSMKALATLMTGALAPARWGRPDLLPGVASGELLLTAALREPPAAPATAVTNGTITGLKIGVPYAAQSHLLLVPARLTPPDSMIVTSSGHIAPETAHDHGVALVRPGAEGVELTRTPSSSGEPEYALQLDQAPVEGMLGGADCVRDLYQLAVAGACALADGVVAGALALTRDYVASREQFGRPLAAFQAVSQQIADVYIASRTMHLAALSACWRLDEGLRRGRRPRGGGVLVRGAGTRSVRLCHHLHGGMGMDVTYPLHRFSSLVADLTRFLPVFIDLTPAQRALRDELRDYFAGLMTPAERAELLTERHGDVYRDVVRRMGEDGWMGVGWPEEYGGHGLGEIEQTIFANEAPRADVHLPAVTLQTVGPTLQEYGTREAEGPLPDADPRRRRALRDRLHRAGRRHRPGLAAHPGRPRRRATTSSTARRSGPPAAHQADYVWLACRTDPDAPKHKGISILIVDTTDPGYSWTPIITADGSHHVNATYYNDVRVPVDMLVGEENQGWKLITTQLNHERVMLGPAGRIEGLRDRVADWAAKARRCSTSPTCAGRWARSPRSCPGQRAAQLGGRRRAPSGATWRTRRHPRSSPPSRSSMLGQELAGVVHRYGDPSDEETADLMTYLDGQAKRNLVLTFGGGVQEVQRELIAMFGLGLPRVPR